ncbi:MAG TPA: DUF4430 domain-containing protein [Solirubrobacteraceae bacterium]|nr:DUF4430 domain-containing protein [Solirubrobacteraceae bacterium]
MATSWTRPAGALAGLLTALALAGCGLAPATPTAVRLLLTREFGARVIQRRGPLKAGEGESVLQLLSSADAVRTNTGAVTSIGDLTAAGAPQTNGSVQSAGSERWVYYVNGVQAPHWPAATSVYAGDHIWWDLHDVSRAPPTPAAIVGAFPEPFLNGIEGKRLPVRVECTSEASACAAVTASLRHFGVPAAIDAVGSGGAPETLRVIVGPWERIDGDLEAQSIALGPQLSGVYARFDAGGRQLVLLDAAGRPVRTLDADAGLIAATQRTKEAPVWVVTGIDEAGVELAARAFNQPTLEDRFAVAAQAAGTTALPVPEGSGGV